MNLERTVKLLTILQIITLSQNSHVQQAKQRIRAEVRSAIGPGSWPPPPPKHHHHHHHHPHQHQPQQRKSHWHAGQRVHRWPSHHNRWSGRGKPVAHHHFTAWSAWSRCDSECVKRRERYCKVKRKCGHLKQLEEHKCWGCHPTPVWQSIKATHDGSPQSAHHTSNNSPAIIINAPHTGLSQLWPPQTSTAAPHSSFPVLEDIEHHPHQHPHLHAPPLSHPEWAVGAEPPVQEDEDFYIIKSKPNYKTKPKPIYIDADDYKDFEVEELDDELEKPYGSSPAFTLLKRFVEPVHGTGTRNQQRGKPNHHRLHQQSRSHPSRRPLTRVTQRNLAAGDDGIEGDIFQYEDFDFEHDAAARGTSHDDQYADSYEDVDYGEYRNGSLVKERATPDALIPRHRRIYSKWSRWTKCSPKCTTRRYKKCRVKEQCGREVLREIAYCYTEGSFCQQWLQAQVQKTPPYELRPVVASRRRDINAADTPQSNAIVSDYIMNGKGYRGPEYSPMKLKCGIAPIRSNKRNMYNMLKIIGGKAARKGEWPWQVAIFNRFKEAFCGGTLIAPEWVLTAAHCVRKVLYVRLGEHNLDYEDGTELQLRVLKSYKHPNFDKKTVDSDVALLRLPKPTNITTWIGYSCLPRPYQPLPKNMDCTVIGWGKRRNRDIAGTSVLHQAEVPIIPMDNCRSVYHDYTITKNMFCAGHKRGRIDTCAGDSGGPLLCRDTTKPNHPWTIFGITSFGDGCAKRNKFGIYAKVPNYVDWAWSVINCNGNCKQYQRGYGN